MRLPSFKNPLFLRFIVLKLAFFQGQQTGFLAPLDVLAHQLFKGFQVPLFHQVHQLVMLPVRRVPPRFPRDGQRRKARDILILALNDAQDAVHFGQPRQLCMEGARTGRKRLDIPRLVKGVHFLQQRTERPDVLGGGMAGSVSISRAFRMV